MAVVKKTLSELNNAVRTEMQLDPGLVSDAERTRFINDCIADLGGLGCFEKRADLSLTDGLASIPDDFVDFISLHRGDVLVPPANIDNSTEGFIPRFPVIEVRPHATETLTFTYAYMPAPVSNDSDVPDLPYGMDVAIIDYAVARAHRKNGNIGLYREYMSAYESKKYDVLQRLTRVQNSRVETVINSEHPSSGSQFGDSTLIM